MVTIFIFDASHQYGPPSRPITYMSVIPVHSDKSFLFRSYFYSQLQSPRMVKIKCQCEWSRVVPFVVGLLFNENQKQSNNLITFDTQSSKYLFNLLNHIIHDIYMIHVSLLKQVAELCNLQNVFVHLSVRETNHSFTLCSHRFFSRHQRRSNGKKGFVS